MLLLNHSYANAQMKEKVNNKGKAMDLVYDFKINQNLFDLLYCPTCKSKLTTIDMLDPFVKGLICENHHRFYVELQTPTMQNSSQCSRIDGPAIEQNDDNELIKAWLTNHIFREKLNNQLATMLRRIYEIHMNNLHINYDYNVFQFCPLCQKPLNIFEQNDIWVEGLKCDSGHEFHRRNGIYFTFEGGGVNFKEDMSDKDLISLVEGWLKGKGNLENNIHPQIKATFKNYKNLK